MSLFKLETFTFWSDMITEIEKEEGGKLQKYQSTFYFLFDLQLPRYYLFLIEFIGGTCTRTEQS